MFFQKWILCTALCLGLTACMTVPKPTTVEFVQADQNKDGVVTLNEWLDSGRIEAAFLAVDRNRIGFIRERDFREALRLSGQASQITQRQQSQVDRQLVAQVELHLKNSAQINSWNINVQSVASNITLSGVVRTAQEKSLVEKITRTVDGVGEVYNQIVIRQ